MPKCLWRHSYRIKYAIMADSSLYFHLHEYFPLSLFLDLHIRLTYGTFYPLISKACKIIFKYHIDISLHINRDY